MNRIRTSVFALALIVTAGAPQRLSAQVGVDPAHSPYHDIVHGNGWTLFAGHVFGDGGPLRMSPNSGSTLGIRYDVRFSRLLQGFVGLDRVAGQRALVNPDDSLVHRFTGPVDQTVWLPQVGMQTNLSGSKSWHGVAPFLGIAMGAARSGDLAADTSGFVFGTKLYLSPSAGINYYLADRLHLRVEGQILYWKMKYPSTWTREPAKQKPASGDPSNAVIKSFADLSDWVPTPALRFGLGFSF